MTFLVVIPAHNEAGRVSKVIQAVKEKQLAVLVVDDGSNDGTAEVARKTGASAVSLSPNRGKGAATREGFKWFLSNSFDALILMDADGQHDVRDLAGFIREIEGGADFVVGNRMANASKMPFIRRATNRTMSFILSAIAKQKIADTQCGYRALHRRVVEKLNLKTNRFEAESEMLLEAARLGFKITSIPVATVYAGESSHIRPFRDTFRFLRFLFQYLCRY